ncbi:bifunctional chorismate mutase/prephenate dehydratase [uncultured Ruthenibacterium sp.]|uniref:bifunctional chorismate mutase/prephenate dehydratase n=1 Tax=uncultured Ruthenibacterium sp. TaxID=1905347 RepID=UPI00349E76C7
MDELLKARAVIDEVDAQMAELFCRRMDAVQSVAAYKKEKGLPVLDASREEAVVAKNLALLPKAEYSELYEDFVRHNMALSRAFQRRMLAMDTVAYQGVEGAFSHIALRKLFPHATARAYPTWSQVVQAVEKGEAVCGVLPFENSHAGDVSEVLDLCFAHETVCVQQVYDLPVSQNLLGIAGAKLSDVKQVVSHPQALQQSAKFLRTLGLSTKPMANTAAAAKYVAETKDPSLAAIASKETAELYGLSVLAEDVNTSENNTTRFIVIGKEMAAAGSRFSLLFTVDHVAGSLARVVQAIGEMGFNMECIKSRPMPHVSWEYYFYVELVGDVSSQSSHALLEKLKGLCRTARVLGVYGRT